MATRGRVREAVLNCLDSRFFGNRTVIVQRLRPFVYRPFLDIWGREHNDFKPWPFMSFVQIPSTLALREQNIRRLGFLSKSRYVMSTAEFGVCRFLRECGKKGNSDLGWGRGLGYLDLLRTLITGRLDERGLVRHWRLVILAQVRKYVTFVP